MRSTASPIFRNAKSNDHRLDIIELVFSVVSRSDIRSAKHYIEELNARFKHASVGYQFVEGKLLRLDSTVAHEELVKPALVLLGRKGFEKADEHIGPRTTTTAATSTLRPSPRRAKRSNQR
jgi:hypothetical protein